MTKKLFTFALFLALIAGFSGLNFNKASAAVNPFPDGCSSALGYSITTGIPCNGTSIATNGPLQGCTTALGYSITNGSPCSGSSIALQVLEGCSSLAGYSTISGLPCNGTTVAQFDPGTITETPGLPTTGASSNTLLNVLELFSLGIIATLGIAYLVRKPSLTRN